MQDVVIAHAATVFRHTTPQQNEAIARDWRALIVANGWQEFFTSEVSLPGSPRWQHSPE